VENQRLLLAAFLSAAVLILWNMAFPPPAPVDVSPEGDEIAVEAPEDFEPGESDAEQQESPTLTEEAEPTAAPGFARVDPEADVLEAAAEEKVVLENGVLRAEFDNRGAEMVSLQLLKEFTHGGEPIEMIRARGSDPHPFALVVEDRSTGEMRKSHPLNKALFTWDRPEENSLRFRYQSPRGAAEKVFTLSERGFLDVRMRVLGTDRWAALLGPGLRDLSSEEAKSRYLQRGVGILYPRDKDLLKPDDDEEEQVLSTSGLRWVTLEDNFFLKALIPKGGLQEVLVRPVVQRETVEEDTPRFLPAGTEIEGEETSAEQMLLLVASEGSMEFELYSGAKRYGTLVDLPYDLQEAARWGFFGILAKPLYYLLEWLHSNVTPNYGWSIVLMTLIIRLLFFPLTWKSQKSMTRMQELNPKVQAIRSKYKSKLRDKQGRPNLDAQRQMNEEVMAIYRNAGVNPMSGCFPMLLQMPVFFGLFKLLSIAVELRNAPWIGWIQDLSVADPYFILPIAMGASSVMMQRIMPAAGDPMQRRIMQMMPIAFTIFAFTFPSGLVLYWVTSNIFVMGQQAIILQSRKKD
jgi:YidC/Oxa1 family membrane protein insertase